MAAEVHLVGLISKLQSASTSPESYFQPSKQLPEETLKRLKLLFDFSKQGDPTKENNSLSLSELMVEGFDDEQIWQQIELHNDPIVSGIRKQVKVLKGSGQDLNLLPQSLDIHSEADSDEEKNNEFDDSNDEFDDADDTEDISGKVLMPASSSEEDNDDGDVENNNHVQLELKTKEKTPKKSTHDNQRGKKMPKRGSVVDDKFFKLSDMNEFLDKMDQQFERNRDGKGKADDDDDDFDFFRDISSGEDDIEDDEEEEDDDEWDNILGNTAKIIGRDVKDSKTSKPKTGTELKYSDYFDPPDGEKQTVDDDDEEMSEVYDEVDEIDVDEEEKNDVDADKDDDENEGDEDEEDNEDVPMQDDDDDDDLMGQDGEEINKDNETKSLSKHEKQQEKLKKKISQLEKENLTKKPWQMSGEAGSTARPMNSLLEEDLNFDHMTAVAPPITEETTQQLEDIIKQRIKDEAWDDVERKQKPVTQPYEYKKKLPLDQEKSKLSLSQIYEQEYVKQTDVKEGPSEEQENEEHKEIKLLMTKLFTKLDALSNFHFTPKPLKPEVKIVTNTPVISMEEVAPVVTSDAMLLAPEETHEKKVELKGDAEKTGTDRKRERRTKKIKQRMKAKEKAKKSKLVSKLNPGLGNKYAKRKALERIEKESKSSKNLSVIKEDAADKALKSSSAFFSQLHDEVKQHVKSKKVMSSEKKKSSKTNTSKLKL